jgi:4-hydroxy-3-polyprenylbenzoate decarboxylase
MRTLHQCVADLQRGGHLVRLTDEVSATLEIAEIQRRVYRRGGPAVLFENVTGCRFPMVSNLFGTIERVRYMFRHTLDRVRRLIELKSDPERLVKEPLRALRALPAVWHMRPGHRRSGPVLARELTIDQLPQLKSWPDDGGAFITLPQVYTEDVDRPGPSHANLGMYRVQLSGGSTRSIARSGCTISSIAELACIMRPRCAAGSRCR